VVGPAASHPALALPCSTARRRRRRRHVLHGVLPERGVNGRTDRLQRDVGYPVRGVRSGVVLPGAQGIKKKRGGEGGGGDGWENATHARALTGLSISLLRKQGPCVTIDTACSASLVAAHLGSSTFTHRSSPNPCSHALAAGVNLTLRSETPAVLAKAGMLAEDGRCKTLDASADGYARGEACVVLLLRAGWVAEEGGAGPTLAVLAGSAINQDGRSGALTAPSGPAQQAVIRAALGAAALAASDVVGLEMHGTGTPLGDPIEVGAARAALRPSPLPPASSPLSLSAAKARLLHTEPAAGATGLASAIARAAGLGAHAFPSLRALNPHVSAALGGTAHACRAPAAAGRLAPTTALGVSAFAYQGTNGHALVMPAAGAGRPSPSPPSPAPWRHRRFWWQACAHPLLGAVGPATARLATFVATPLATSPCLAWLGDHSVGRRAIAPSAALCELALAAGVALLQAGNDSPACPCVVAGVALASPLRLVAGAEAAMVSVDLASGGVRLVTGSTVHLTGRLLGAVESEGGVASPATPLAHPLARHPLTPTPSRPTCAAIAPPLTPPAGYWTHPALGDAAIHAATALRPTGDKAALISTGLASYAPRGGGARGGRQAAWAAASARPGAGGATTSSSRLINTPSTPWTFLAGPALCVEGVVAVKAGGGAPQPARAPAAAASTITLPLPPFPPPPPSFDETLATLPLLNALPPDAAAVDARFDAWANALLGVAFAQFGVYRAGPGAPIDTAALRATTTPAHQRLLAELIEAGARGGLLVRGGGGDDDSMSSPSSLPTPDPAFLATEGAALSAHPATSAAAKLLGPCAAALPAVLTGKAGFADAMFPGGSPHLVEPVYKNPLVSAPFNAQLAAAVVAFADATPPDQPFRVLEIGSGSGGTSDPVLKALDPLVKGEGSGQQAQPRTVEFTYTDLSPALAAYGRRTYGPSHPFATFRTLDVEGDLVTQAVELGAYDVVLATNVLHATSDMGRTLGACKALLRSGGLLLANELASKTLFLTLTFGQTTGWWAYVDGARRVPGSPILDADRWVGLMKEAGFGRVQVLGSANAASRPRLLARQAVIAGLSDGVVSVRRATSPTGPATTQPPPPPPPPQPTAAAAGPTEAAVLARVLALTAGLLGGGGGPRPATPDPTTPFTSAGLDSIAAVELRDGLAGEFGVDLPATAVFDHPTPLSLSRFIAGRAAALAGMPPPPSPSSSSAPALAVLAPGAGVVAAPPPPAAAPQPSPSVSPAAVQAELGALLAGVLGLPSPPPVDAPLSTLGLDSIGAVELRNVVQTRWGVDLPATAAFDFPTLAALAGVILAGAGGPGRGQEQQAPVAHPLLDASLVASHLAWAGNGGPPSISTPTPITALACALPGANGPAPLDLGALATGTDPVRPLPLARWDVDASAGDGRGGVPALSDPRARHPRFAALLASDPAGFDAAAFRMGRGAAEAAALDPQQRLLLESAAEALLTGNALSPANGEPSPVGVYVGCVWQEWAAVQGRLGVAETAAVLTGSGLNFMVGRVSFAMGLSGPCVGLDTACSSSLVAAHLARRALAAGEAACALAGGVNLLLLPDTGARMGVLGSLSPTGRCASLDATADGYGRGEGCALVLLGGLAPPLALLVGTAINQAGTASGLTAPSGPAQAAVVRAALRDAHGRASPGEVAGVALHGTGTPLGDPIEVGGLGDALGGGTGAASRPHAVALISAKAVYGHTEGAAGVHGALAALFAARTRTAPPMLHARALNPYVVAALSKYWVSVRAPPAAVPRGGVPLVRRSPARPSPLTGSSSFGMSGVNAHALVEGKAVNVLAPPPPVAWRRARAWPAPPHHAMLWRGLPSTAAAARFTIVLALPCLAHLGDHIVAGRPILPGAAMLEAGLAAVATLSAAADEEGGAGQAGLSGATLPAPVLLTPPLPNLEVVVGLGDGGVSLGIVGGRPSLRATAVWVGGEASSSTSSAFFTHPSRLVRRPPLLSPPAPWIAAIAAPGLARDGFFSPPASTDSAMQLGPALAADSEGPSQSARVVARVGAYTAPVVGGLTSPWASSQRSPGPGWETWHRLGGGGGVVVAGLLAKEVGGRAAVEPASALIPATAPLLASDCLYAVDWRVSEPARAPSGRIGRSLTLRTPTKTCTLRGSGPATSAAARAVAAAVGAGLPSPSATLLCRGGAAVDVAVTTPSPYCSSFVTRVTAAASAAAVLRVAAAEMPSVRWSVVDASAGSAASIPVDAAHSAAGPAAVSGGAMYKPRLLRTPPSRRRRSSTAATAPGFGFDGASVISGGTGAVGSLLGLWLAEASPASRVTLLGRTGHANPGDCAALRVATGPTPPATLISLVRADAGSCSEAGSCLANTSAHARLRSIIHAGAVLDPAVLPNATLASIRTEGGAKAGGGARLAAATAAHPLAAWHSMSSLAAFAGSGGQGAYAAANAALDAWAAAASAAGTPASSIQWGAWGGGAGMAARVVGFAARAARAGLGVLAPSVGVAALEAVMEGGSERLAGRPITVGNVFLWESVKPDPGGLFGEFAPSPTSTSRRKHNDEVEVVAHVPNKAPSPRPPTATSSPAVRATALAAIAAVLPAAAADLGAPLSTVGLDSLAAIDLRNGLAAALGLPTLPASLAYDFSTAGAVLNHVVGLVGGRSEGVEEVVDTTPTTTTTSSLPPTLTLPALPPSPALTVEIVAVSAAFPGAPTTLAGLFAVTSTASDPVTLTPLDRWDVEGAYSPAPSPPGASYVRHAAWLPSPDLASLDAAAFRLSPVEAASMDPQGRLLLTHAAAAWAATSKTSSHSPSTVGFFVGVMHIEFVAAAAGRWGAPVTPAMATGNGMDFLAGRVSHALGWTGPAATVHTACSSSLVAAHLARAALTTGNECNTAGVGGVHAMLLPGTMAGICQLQALSPAGRSRALDAGADGYGRGEAVAVCLLRARGGPISSTHPPLALLAGTAVGQAGTTSGLTAPSGPAQTAVVRAAYEVAALSPSALMAVALHGTGTPLGDPIEVSALAAALSSFPRAPITLAAPKTSVGHTEGCAGLTNLLTALVAGQGGCVAPIAHLRSLNPHVGAALRDWSSGSAPAAAWAPRMPGPGPVGLAGASAFGMSGVNSHALVLPGSGSVVRRAEKGSPWSPRPAAHWPAPRSLLLAWRALAAASPSVASFDIALAHPALSWLSEHTIAGRSILPATAMLEAGAAAATCLRAGAEGWEWSGRGVGLAAMAFASPLSLDGPCG